MRKPLFLMLTFMLIMSTALFSCLEDNGRSNEKDNTFKIAEKRNITNGGITYNFKNLDLSITFDNDGSNSLSSDDKSVINDFFKKWFDDDSFIGFSEIDAFFSYSSDREVKETITLHGKGDFQNGEHTIVAVEFYGDGDGTGGDSFGGNGTNKEHKCTGAPCKCCKFLYDYSEPDIFGNKSKWIVGCDCKTTGECFTIDGKCNHTVSHVTNSSTF